MNFVHVMEEDFLMCFVRFDCEITFLRTLCGDTHEIFIILHLICEIKGS